MNLLAHAPPPIQPAAVSRPVAPSLQSFPGASRMNSVAMERICQIWSHDETKLEFELRQAKDHWVVVNVSGIAMHHFSDELIRIQCKRQEMTPNTAAAAFEAVFRDHMPIMAGCRYNPSAAVLHSLVDKLRSRQCTWDDVDGVFDAVIREIWDAIYAPPNIRGSASLWLHGCEDRLSEVRRLSARLRSTCRTLKFPVQAPVA